VTGATVADTLPAILTATWTCVGAGGGTCTASGSGNNSVSTGNGENAAAAASQIPALSDWALMLAGMLLGLSGWWALRLKS